MAELQLRAGAAPQSTHDPCDWFRQVLPDEVLTSRLSTAAKLIGGYLWARAGWREGTIVPTSHGQLMQLVGRSEKRCREYLAELVDAGFLGRVSNHVGRHGGMEFRVFGPGRLAERFKLLNRPDGDQLSLWPFDDPEDSGGATALATGESAAETRRKRGVFDGVSAGFSAARPARACITNSSVAGATEEETTTSTSTSKSMLKLQFTKQNGGSAPGALGKPGENAANPPHPASARAKAIDAALTLRFGRPNELQRQFVVLAALLAEGHRVRVAAPGRPDAIVGVAAGGIEAALEAALRAPRQDVSKVFYCLVRDRLRAAVGNERARMPHAEFIREACTQAGLEWNEAWRQSSADLYRAWYDQQQSGART